MPQRKSKPKKTKKAYVPTKPLITHKWPEPPTLEALNNVLNSYPEGTKGYEDARELIRDLRQLCIRHGFGNVPQVAEWIRTCWYGLGEHTPPQERAKVLGLSEAIEEQRVRVLEAKKLIEEDTKSGKP